MKKYRITLTEEQLMLIANCVEDCHRFACGQTELWNTTSTMETHGELKAKMQDLHDFAVPKLGMWMSYDWSGESCEDAVQRAFIRKTYAIYREILHKVVNEGVYKRETLTCEDNGGLPIIEEVKD